MTHHIPCIVIGAGVIGLAIARELQLRGIDTCLIERNTSFGMETSARNSEVIHAGIYYPQGSFKARLCVEGKHLLYDYCIANGIPYRQIGKLIVATSEHEIPMLARYMEGAKANGVHDLEWMDAADIAQREPHITALKGLWSPSTGIIDSHAFMAQMLADFQSAGGIYVVATEVTQGRITPKTIQLDLMDRGASTVTADTVINAAGHHAPLLASRVSGLPKASIPTPRYAAGHYYTLRGKAPFRHLVYPVAEKAGLGIHVTLDMAGQARFGPDVQWRDSLDYRFDASSKPRFVEAIRRYWPGVQADDLVAGYVGVRPKITAAHEPASDFHVQRANTDSDTVWIDLYGIESPGLTASLAIARYVAVLRG
jgi:L-2-hydroxyglutarate oxidase LhgO